MTKRIRWLLIAGVFLSLVAGSGWLAYRYVFPPLPPDLNQRPAITVHIPRGATFNQVLDSLRRHQLVQHPDWFRFLATHTHLDRRIPAGYFLVPQGLNSWQLVRYLQNPRKVLVKVTIPEGMRTEKIGSLLQRKLGIDSARFVSLVYDTAFARTLNVPASTANGFLMPETYFFPMGISEKEVIKLLVAPTLEIFRQDSVQRQLQRLKMTPLEIVTLASIIEGEAMVDSERTLISSVYHNRLKRGWRLQADPTIQFLLQDGPRRLTYRDLQIDSPYNTYKYRGLPPGPINNPGKASILAALFPANTRYLYFVATGDGGHHFSATLREHNRWKRRFDAIRREVYRKKRRK